MVAISLMMHPPTARMRRRASGGALRASTLIKGRGRMTHFNKHIFANFETVFPEKGASAQFHVLKWSYGSCRTLCEFLGKL